MELSVFFFREKLAPAQCPEPTNLQYVFAKVNISLAATVSILLLLLLLQMVLSRNTD